MTQTEMMKLGMALGICFAAYKFVGNPLVKTAALAVGGVIVARKVPVLTDALA
ncbi:hypothetical protein [Duganella radicis]|uniref:Uncharacterized protein n=1 Tax=Duganella radicis TaxID=551988 RepID=A0A6L6PB32_9BURK|nr:hypothetical protein [Duganella radicis]MTV36276.1 hypothetical protein [Duganella radicis]